MKGDSHIYTEWKTKAVSITTWFHWDIAVPSSIPEGASALFVSGLCRWPGCDAVFKDFASFLK